MRRTGQDAGGTPDRETYLAMAELLRRQGAAHAGPVGLTPYELRVFSQNGEDGVIAEILRRAGVGSRTFVEFGAGTGHENNCAFLADVLGWGGFFIEASTDEYLALETKYRFRPDVVTANSLLTPANIEETFRSIGVPPEPAVLSIDVDGRDYWLWRSLLEFRPRIVVIEYNAGLAGALAEPRDAASPPGHWSRFGASIGAMTRLGRDKGYRLVHAELAGVNAFFVRDDLDGPWPDRVLERSPNYDLRGYSHPEGAVEWQYVDVGGG